MNSDLKKIEEKVFNNEKISTNDAMLLFEQAELGFAGRLANHIREQKHKDNTYFIKNFHIEPSNICIYNCKFCSYSDKQADVSWDYSITEIIDSIRKYDNQPMKEAHITGSVNPDRDINYYIELIKAVRKHRPELKIKAFSAVEIYYITQKASTTYEDVLTQLKNAGVDALPGGGAEIFDEELRNKICPDKVSSTEWLKIHETAHGLGIKTNATMLYGHIESYSHRIDHLNRLRELQDATGGFGAFIPLKFRHMHNEMSDIKECSVIEDMKNYAVSRIFLDNFPHIKSYWPMLGKSLTQVALSFGVDDIDGTIEDTTKIYSLAGSEEQNPGMSADEMVELIKSAHRIPVER